MGLWEGNAASRAKTGHVICASPRHTDVARQLCRFAKAGVLVLDGAGLAPLTDHQRHDGLGILEERHGAGSTVVTSQLPVETWRDHIAPPTVADAVLDRLVHDAHKLTMKGPSRRKEKAPNH